MNNFLQTLRNLGPVRLAAMGAVALGLIGFFIYVTTRLSQPQMALLYSDLPPADAGAISQKLQELKVPFESNPEGTRIMVPADQVGKMRMAMAQSGLPNGGSTGYEIFDKPEGFGTTSFIQNINHLRALEGEMARTVGTLAQVQTARVHLVLPKREMFSTQTTPATASVFLRLRPGAQLKREQITAIQHLIAASVPQLDPSQISIIDDRGNLLARGMGASSQDLANATAEEKTRGYEQRLARTVEDLLSRTVGYGKVRAEISAQLDFDRVTTNSETFDPDSQVVRSTQTVNEQNQANDRNDTVTVANNLPPGDNTETAGSGTGSKSSRSEETINYEISRTVRNHVRETGQVRRLSVAVLVDGSYEPGESGQPPAYKQRSPDELKQIEALVRSAIGFDGVRGDTVEVINMRFTAPDADLGAGAADGLFGLGKEDLFRIGEMLIMAIVAVLVILLVIRPLMARIFERSAAAEEEAAERLLTDQSTAQAQLTGPGQSSLAENLALEDAQAEEELEQMIDISRVEGRVRASSLRKVGEIVEKHPEEAVSIIRNWLYQET